MRSFRLDPGSVTSLLDSWPSVVVGLGLAAGFVYVGIEHAWGRVIGLALVGIYGGYLIRGLTADRLREKYPTAHRLWLLSVGMTTITLGVGVRMAFPQAQGTAFDVTWLGVSFASILAFVLLNRNNVDVVR